MNRHINYEAKTPKELLIIVAGRCDEMTDHLAKLNGTVQKHTDAIAKNRNDIIALQARGCDNSNSSWKSTIRTNWQVLSILATLGALIMIKIVEKFGWW